MCVGQFTRCSRLSAADGRRNPCLHVHRARPRTARRLRALGAPVVELHTGAYARCPSGAARATKLLKHIHNAAEFGADLGWKSMPAMA